MGVSIAGFRLFLAKSENISINDMAHLYSCYIIICEYNIQCSACFDDTDLIFRIDKFSIVQCYQCKLKINNIF